MLWSYKKCQKIEVWKKLGRVMATNVFVSTIPDKTENDKKSLISMFACFFTAIANVFT